MILAVGLRGLASLIVLVALVAFIAGAVLADHHTPPPAPSSVTCAQTSSAHCEVTR